MSKTISGPLLSIFTTYNSYVNFNKFYTAKSSLFSTRYYVLLKLSSTTFICCRYYANSLQLTAFVLVFLCVQISCKYIKP